jgi:hypothetical protein
MSGFQEEQTAYVPQNPRDLIGQFRNLGSAGPAYEIMDIDDAGNVIIELVYSEERLVYPLSEILADPMAETIP